MELERIYPGKLCASSKGYGKVTSVDAEHHSVHMADFLDNHDFEVDIDEVYDDPQIHNPEDGYY